MIPEAYWKLIWHWWWLMGILFALGAGGAYYLSTVVVSLPLTSHPPSTYKQPPTLQTAGAKCSACISAMATHWLADGLYLSTDFGL